MRLFISKILNRLGRRLVGYSKFLHINRQEKRCIPWFNDNGDKTLRLEYTLTDSSVVFDLGGYEGQWTSDIFSMYGCSIHVFEPVEEFATKIKQRFSQNHKIFVYQYGLSNQNRQLQIFLNGDSSSTFKSEAISQEIFLIKAIDFIQNNNISSIDLMKINIEGGEYELLEHLLDNDFIANITNIQVQFHDFVPNAEERMTRIQQELNKTHSLTYQYPFVWENWQRKQ
jgi:FkbM family methyltransferase